MTPSSFSRISQRLLTRQTCIIRLSNGLVGDGLVTSCDAFGSLVVQPDLPQYPNILRNSACKMGEQYIHKPKKEIFGFLKTWYLTARVLCFLRTWDLTARGWSKLVPFNNHAYMNLSYVGMIWFCVRFQTMLRSLACTSKKMTIREFNLTWLLRVAVLFFFIDEIVISLYILAHSHLSNMHRHGTSQSWNIPVVLARGRAEVALGFYYKTFFIYRTCVRRAPPSPVRACLLCGKWCAVVVQEHDPQDLFHM